jgi:hypothetical protein
VKKQHGRYFGQDLMRGEHTVGNGQKAKAERLLLPPSADAGFYVQKRAKEKELGRKLTTQEFYEHYVPRGAANVGTSIFDPVLAEMVYRWFCPEHGRVLDPFAGGSVRGIVASVLGLDYTGVDLSEMQLRANRDQAGAICKTHPPKWIVGDSRNLMSLIDGGDDGPKVDLVFSCPPYFDLEVYSEDPADLSNMAWPDFVASYWQIIASAVECLKPDRFACFVVSDVRDKAGFYRGLVRETIGAFGAAGMALYNDAVLVTTLGSLPIRVRRQFEAGRKLSRTHQNVLVFYKGDTATLKDWPVPEFALTEPLPAGATDPSP